MIPRASSSSTKTARFRVRLPESRRNAESLRSGQSPHNRGVTQTRTPFTVISDRIYQIDIDSPASALKYPAQIKSSLSSTRSIGLFVSPRAQFSRPQTSRLFSSCSRPKATFTFSIFDSDPNMALLTPPQAPARWNHTPEEVLSITKQALAQSKAVNDKVAALPETECNFETVRDTSSLHRQTKYLLSSRRFS